MLISVGIKQLFCNYAQLQGPYTYIKAQSIVKQLRICEHNVSKIGNNHIKYKINKLLLPYRLRPIFIPNTK